MSGPTSRRAARRTAAVSLALLASVVALLAALAAPVAASASPGTAARPTGTGRTAFPPERPTRVLAVGDSVMEGAAGAIGAALPGREVVVDTEVSRSTGASADAAAAQGTDWDVVVVLLAHNDGGSPGAYQPAYRRLLDTFAAVPQVVVLTLHEVRPYYADVNAFLRAEAEARPNVTVADWNAVTSGAPGSTAGDGLHLSGSGARLMADLVAGEVVAAELAAVPPPTTLPPTTTTTVAPTTTAPPTTTTLPPTTTSTSTTTSTTEPPPPVVPTATASPARASEEPDDDEGGPVSPGIGLALGVAAVAVTGGLTAVARRLPR